VEVVVDIMEEALERVAAAVPLHQQLQDFL
jgi:hypothetical protein